jgi:hypothetical protein
VCELALAQGVPGFSLLSERRGEGATAQGPELSSKKLRLLLVCHGYCECLGVEFRIGDMRVWGFVSGDMRGGFGRSSLLI